MSDPSCRAFRELLGVYVVGAIEPAERTDLEVHVSQCYDCREELAGLALLPALMHRVPPEDAERLLSSGSNGSPVAPSADLLNSLLRRVGARRRTRRLRAAFAIAAAVLIGISGAAAVSHAAGHPTRPTPAIEVATARTGDLAVTVHYNKTSWGTTMSVRATGLAQWTRCQFWVVTKDGRHSLVGGWLIGAGGNQLWYPVQASVPESSIRGFILIAEHVHLRIPAA